MLIDKLRQSQSAQAFTHPRWHVGGAWSLAEGGAHMVNVRWLTLNFVFAVGARAPTVGYVASPQPRMTEFCSFSTWPLTMPLILSHQASKEVSSSRDMTSLCSWWNRNSLVKSAWNEQVVDCFSFLIAEAIGGRCTASRMLQCSQRASWSAVQHLVMHHEPHEKPTCQLFHIRGIHGPNCTLIWLDRLQRRGAKRECLPLQVAMSLEQWDPTIPKNPVIKPTVWASYTIYLFTLRLDTKAWTRGARSMILCPCKHQDMLVPCFLAELILQYFLHFKL